MKIKLIYPEHYKFNESSNMRFAFSPPLSLPQIAALTPENVEVSIIDENIESINFEEDVDLVGISVKTLTASRAYEIADKYRKKGIKVVLGGIHPSLLPEEAINHADAVCIGEAEGYWIELIQDFKMNKLKRFYTCQNRPNLSRLPIPRRELLKKHRYIAPNLMQTTRGCPFNCNFCSVTKFFGNTYRTRPIDEVLKEVYKLIEENRDGKLFLGIVDDNFAAIPQRTKELLKKLKALKIYWFSQVTLSIVKNKELLKLISESGCIGLLIGFESINDESTKEINNPLKSSKNIEENIKILHDFEIPIIASFTFGFDHDDKNTFEKTVEFVIKNKIDSVLYNILTPFPGTKLYNALNKSGRIIDRNWAHYDLWHVVFKPALMSEENLLQGYEFAHKETYSFLNILKRNKNSIGAAVAGILFHKNRNFHNITLTPFQISILNFLGKLSKFPNKNLDNIRIKNEN